MKRNTKCPVCNYDCWEESPITRIINPNGEYVKGYGHTPVQRIVGNKYRCIRCGYEEGGNPTIVDIDGNVIGTIGKKD